MGVGRGEREIMMFCGLVDEAIEWCVCVCKGEERDMMRLCGLVAKAMEWCARVCV